MFLSIVSRINANDILSRQAQQQLMNTINAENQKAASIPDMAPLIETVCIAYIIYIELTSFSCQKFLFTLRKFKISEEE